jgi:hypothetical protein
MVKLNNPFQPKFTLGQIGATPGALEVLKQSNQSPMEFILRHVQLDGGCLSAEDRKQNELAVADEGNFEHQERVFSAFLTKTGEKLWVITEASRERTTLLLPSEY